MFLFFSTPSFNDLVSELGSEVQLLHRTIQKKKTEAPQQNKAVQVQTLFFSFIMPPSIHKTAETYPRREVCLDTFIKYTQFVWCGRKLLGAQVLCLHEKKKQRRKYLLVYNNVRRPKFETKRMPAERLLRGIALGQVLDSKLERTRS